MLALVNNKLVIFSSCLLKSSTSFGQKILLRNNKVLPFSHVIDVFKMDFKLNGKFFI